MPQNKRPTAGPRIAAARAVGEQMHDGQCWTSASSASCDYRISSRRRGHRAFQRALHFLPPAGGAFLRDCLSPCESNPRLAGAGPRQANGERAAAADLAFQRHFAPQAVCTILSRSTSPKPGAGIFPRDRVALRHDRLPLAEFFEDGHLIFFGDADAGIRRPSAASSPRSASSTFARTDNAATFGRELDRVGKQIAENLLHLRPDLETAPAARARRRLPSRCSCVSVCGRKKSHWAWIDIVDAKIGQAELPFCRFRFSPDRECR